MSSDEAAGRVLAFVDAWRTVRQSGDSLIKALFTNHGPIYLDENDLRALLDERGQLREACQLAEAQLTEIGSERAEWKARAQRGDVVAKILRADLDKTTARAGQAEAEVERLKARGSHRTLDELAAEQGVGPFDPDAWPVPEGQLSPEEFAAFEAGIAECRGNSEPEYRFLMADGRESEFDLHNGPCDCQRQVRDVYVTPWRSVEQQRQDGEEGSNHGDS